MTRREYTARFRCGYEGCNEYAHYSCGTRAEVTEMQRRYHPDKWRCTRHTQPQEVLSADNSIRTYEMTVFAETHGNYWGVEKAWSGFIYGPGFKAYAKDFSPGTRIKVTAEIISAGRSILDGGREK